MQSFLAYRKFRRNLEEQIQRHGLDKVAGCAPQPETDREHPTEAGGRKEDELLPSEEGIQPRDHATEEKELENEKPRQRHENGTALLAPPSTGLSRQTSEHKISSANGSLHRSSTQGSSLSRPSSRATSRANSTASRPNHLSTAQTRSTIGAGLGQTLTGVEVRTRKTNEGGPERGKVFVVGYQGPDDPLNPHNWSKTKRVAITLLVASIGLIVGVASSIDSAAIPQASKEFHVSEVTESLATAIYLVGFGFGAFTAAPVSETVGRNPVYIVTMLLFMIWVLASALAPNIGAQLVFRFLAGYFGSTPLTCAGGSISDMWDATQRTAIFPMFANAAFWGPGKYPLS